MLEYHKMTEEEKYCIARWKYPGEYAIYNSLSYEEQKKRGFGFGGETGGGCAALKSRQVSEGGWFDLPLFG